MGSRIRIEVRRGVELVETRTCEEGTGICLGRSPQADLVLDDRQISRRHAMVEPGERDCKVTDLSANGVELGGERLAPEATVRYGESLVMGPFAVRLFRGEEGEAEVDRLALRRQALRDLIDNIDLSVLGRKPEQLRPRVEAALERIVHAQGVFDRDEVGALVSELADEALGLGPLEKLLRDDSVSEIMVVGPTVVFVERGGRIERTDLSFTSEDSVRTIIERIVTPLGRRIDEASPMVDARLPDGSRVNAVIPPLAIRGPSITIRKFARNPLSMEDLIRFGTLDRPMADFLRRAVAARRNLVISGGTGSGKTTLLNVLAGSIPSGERIITIEDAAELRLPQPHVVTLETRPPNTEGRGMVTIRDLVRNSLRMRPDRIVVGECRGGEALDMLQAMNTGHDGSMTTTHANSPAEAMARLETLSLMAGVDLPSRAIREQISAAVDLVVQQTRMGDGARRITSIAEVRGMEEDGSISICEIFRYTGDREGAPFLATGWLSSLDLDDGEGALRASGGRR
jgi:pilus assembly protein CpaF